MNSGFKNSLVATRNAVFGFLYKFFLKPFLFLMDPEDVHNWFINCGKFLGRYSLLRWKTRVWLGFADKSLEQNVAGIRFKNPVGLAAGFDKNAELSGNSSALRRQSASATLATEKIARSCCLLRFEK